MLQSSSAAHPKHAFSEGDQSITAYVRESGVTIPHPQDNNKWRIRKHLPRGMTKQWPFHMSLSELGTFCPSGKVFL
jgi:hypothetical protein